ncbi:hypothetical protein [Escherichia coli]|uniref:hypothetical protein n=1 Tax=Escherichia coli TaxID=562 RepID=UPI0035B487EC
MSDLYEPLEFVFCGFRKGDAGLFISVATLRDGVLGREMYFSKGKSKRRWVVGGIYSGASFSDNGAKGLDDAHYVKAWEVQGDKIAYSHAWRSLNNIHADHVITSMPITQ